MGCKSYTILEVRAMWNQPKAAVTWLYIPYSFWYPRKYFWLMHQTAALNLFNPTLCIFQLKGFEEIYNLKSSSLINHLKWFISSTKTENTAPPSLRDQTCNRNLTCGVVNLRLRFTYTPPVTWLTSVIIHFLIINGVQELFFEMRVYIRLYSR